MTKGWPTKTLGAVCEVMNGGTPKTGVPEYWDGSHLWITPAEMGKRLTPYVDDTERKITDLGLRNSSAQMLPPNSVILSSRAPIGHLVINTAPMATNQGCKGLIPGSQLQHKFLYYYLSSIVDLLNALGAGATFKELSGGKLKEVTIPVPPLPEQKRIVGILDEAFAGIATAKANAEKNLQNARALFESHLQSVFAQRGPGWVETTLGKVCQFENGDRGKNYPNRAEYVESGIPWINTGHIQPDGTLSRSEMNFISREKYESLRSGKIQPGDLVYCLRGATLGKTALVDPFTVGAVASSLVIIRPGGLLDRRFLYYFLTSSLGQGLIKLYYNGAAQPNLGAKSVAKYTISLPKLAEQEVIVQKLAALTAETQRLARLYERKLAALKALKKSLLHQAFTGQL
jgi:type I restriction enzyme, S subunit